MTKIPGQCWFRVNVDPETGLKRVTLIGNECFRCGSFFRSSLTHKRVNFCRVPQFPYYLQLLSQMGPGYQWGVECILSDEKEDVCTVILKMILGQWRWGNRSIQMIICMPVPHKGSWQWSLAALTVVLGMNTETTTSYDVTASSDGGCCHIDRCHYSLWPWQTSWLHLSPWRWCIFPVPILRANTPYIFCLFNYFSRQMQCCFLHEQTFRWNTYFNPLDILSTDKLP